MTPQRLSAAKRNLLAELVTHKRETHEQLVRRLEQERPYSRRSIAVRRQIEERARARRLEARTFYPSKEQS